MRSCGWPINLFAEPISFWFRNGRVATSRHFLLLRTLYPCDHGKETTMADLIDLLTAGSVFLFLISVLIFA